MSPSVPATVAVRISVHGFIGGEFLHADHDVKLPAGQATLRGLFDYCRDHLDLDVWNAIELKERLRDNVMVNGDRWAMAVHADIPLPADAQVALLAPKAGG